MKGNTLSTKATSFLASSHFLYFFNAAYSDSAFTSTVDTEDPMVIVKLDISNTFISLCARLVLDVLSCLGCDKQHTKTSCLTWMSFLYTTYFWSYTQLQKYVGYRLSSVNDDSSYHALQWFGDSEQVVSSHGTPHPSLKTSPVQRF